MGKPGFSSPVVWNHHLFITGADEDSREVSCYNTENGELRWSQSVPTLPGPAIEFPNVDQDTGYAPITGATDGTRIFAMFNTGELACFDFEGSFIWGKIFGLPDNPMGHASSLALYQDLLLVQMDQEKGSELLALNTATGNVVWRTSREVATAWSSPIWADVEGTAKIFLNGAPLIAAYDARSGEELWSIDCMEGEVCPSPTVGGGKALFVTEYAKMYAIDIATGTEVWSVEEEFPDVSSPVATDTAIFFGNNSGMITCLNLASGDVAWTEEFDDGFYSSPIAVGDLIYFSDMGGITHIFKNSLTYEPIAHPALGENIVTTPAFLDGRIYIRGSKNLYCIGEAQ
jgi:outer membrane protein assembly factor BamB